MPGATDQLPPARVVMSVWTSSSGPPATGRRILTVTSVASPGAFPALPPKSGVVSLVADPFAGVVSATAGSVMSTVQLALAGVGFTLPAGSIARTWKVCVVASRPDRCLGDVQAVQGPPSSRHSNVASGWLATKARSGSVNGVPPTG